MFHLVSPISGVGHLLELLPKGMTIACVPEILSYPNPVGTNVSAVSTGHVIFCPSNVSVSIVILPVPLGLSNKFVSVVVVDRTFVLKFISSTCNPVKFTPVLSTEPEATELAVKFKVLFVGCATKLVSPSSAYTPPNGVYPVFDLPSNKFQ